MTSTQVLGDFVSALASGAIEVVDLTAPLGPETPLIKLPPEIGKNTPPIEVHEYTANHPDEVAKWYFENLKPARLTEATLTEILGSLVYHDHPIGQALIDQIRITSEDLKYTALQIRDGKDVLDAAPALAEAAE